MIGPRMAYNISEKEQNTTNEEAGYINLRDDDMHKLNFSVSGALGYVISDKVEVYLDTTKVLSKVYPHYEFRKTWNRLMGLGISYYFN